MQGTRFDAEQDDSGWVYDATGHLCRPEPVSGDTATGVAECMVFDHRGRPVIGESDGKLVTITRQFPPPLTIIPVVSGQEPPETLTGDDVTTDMAYVVVRKYK